MFGELALINDDLRSASVVTNTYSEFMILNKDAFELVKNYYTKDMIQKKKFLYNYVPGIKDRVSKVDKKDILMYFS
jgi:CRP-like cAMP-binding protein